MILIIYTKKLKKNQRIPIISYQMTFSILNRFI